MIGLDTNVLVRYLVRDDEAQFRAVQALIDNVEKAGDLVLVGILTLMETEWVLRSRYQLSKDRIISVLDAMLETTKLRFEDERVVESALHHWKTSGAEFADCLIVAKYMHSGCAHVATFDRKAAALPGASLLLP